MAGEFLFLVAFNILLQSGKDKYKERIQREKTIQELLKSSL